MKIFFRFQCNTFQSVIASNGNTSYAILSYNLLEYYLPSIRTVKVRNIEKTETLAGEKNLLQKDVITEDLWL